MSKVLGGALCSTPLNNAVKDPSGQIGQAIFESNTVVGVSAPTGTTTFVVTVVNESGNKFAIDGVTRKPLTLVRGATYIFDQADATNAGHVIQISATSTGANVSYATAAGTAGQGGAKTTVVVPHNAPSTLYYNCTAHGAGMGNVIYVVSPTAVISGANIPDAAKIVQQRDPAEPPRGVVKTNPDVSGNSGSASSLYSGDLQSATGLDGAPVFVHDISAASFANKEIRSMTFWLRTSEVDASLNLVDYATIFDAVENGHDTVSKRVKLTMRNDTGGDNDRLAIVDTEANANIARITINGVNKTI